MKKKVWFLSLFLLLLGFGWWYHLGRNSVVQFSFQGPSLATYDSWLGRDELGKPLLWKLMHATLNSLGVSSLALFLSLVLGFLFGSHALWNRNLRAVMHGMAASVIVLPSFLTVLLLKLLLESAFTQFYGMSLICLVWAMALEGWVPFAYFVEAEIDYALSQEYVKASEALGATPLFLFRRHIFSTLRKSGSRFTQLQFSHFILAESFISFLGLGVRPPMYSLGGMLALGFENIIDAPHLFLAPAFVLVLLNLCLLKGARRQMT